MIPISTLGIGELVKIPKYDKRVIIHVSGGDLDGRVLDSNSNNPVDHTLIQTVLVMSHGGEVGRGGSGISLGQLERMSIQGTSAMPTFQTPGVFNVKTVTKREESATELELWVQQHVQDMSPGSGWNEEPTLKEKFNEQRRQKCIEVFKKITDASYENGTLDCRAITDESLFMKPLAAVEKMYFSFGPSDDLTELTFLEMLVVFKMILEHFKIWNERQEKNETGEYQEKITIKTHFTPEEAMEILQAIMVNVEIEIREK